MSRFCKLGGGKWTTPMIRRLLAFLAFIVIRIWIRLLRIRMVDRQHSLLAIERGQPVLYAFFHGQQLALFGYSAPRPLVQMASLSKDGEWQAEFLRLMGFSVVRGSPGRRGREALFEMTEFVLKGCHAALAVDGSRGPYHVVKPGILSLARDSGGVIIPLAASSAYRSVLGKSWDQYEIPWPFSKVVIVEGEPMTVDVDIDPDGFERMRAELERRLKELTHYAESMVRPEENPGADILSDDEDNEGV